jgi:transcriptional regulator with XRE-family HTH domain
MDTHQQLAENIRYLLWKDRFASEEWKQWLARCLNCDSEYAEKILLGKVNVSDEHLKSLLEQWGYEEGILRYSKLAQEETNVLTLNLNYIFDNLDRGIKKAIALHLNVHPTTISRWCAGENKPTENNLDGLKDYIGISKAIDLTEEPLFLSLSPMSDLARRQWLHKHIDELSTDELAKLFPALEKLLG